MSDHTVASLAPIPALKPGVYSAYRVMQFVNKLILEEPLRFNMVDILCAYKNPYDAACAQTPDYMDTQLELAPACGTVGCHVGWTGLALRMDTAFRKHSQQPVGANFYYQDVMILLTGHNIQTHGYARRTPLYRALFAAYFNTRYFNGFIPGTPAYAAHVVNTVFLPVMRKFRRQLQARKIRVYANKAPTLVVKRTRKVVSQ